MEVEMPPEANKPKAQDLLDTLFERITRTLAETDAFTKADAPSFFIIYAHDNPGLGTANSGLVRELIDELKTIRLKILSDRSPTLRPWFTLEEGNVVSNDAVHDIVSNQFCILPKAGPSTETSVKKVILCYSDVLQGYHEISRMKKYTQEIKDFYFQAQGENKHPQDIQDGIRAIVKKNHKTDGFHHVLTELAFLEIRTTVVGNSRDIIPIMLSGDDIISLPYFRGSEPVYLKAERSPAMIHSCQIQHKTFFNLLRRLYEDQRECVDEFDNCYWKCAEGLSSESKLPSRNEFEESISLEIYKSVQKLIGHGTAGLRAIRHIELRSSTQRAYIDTLAFKEMDYRMQEIREAYEDTSTWLTKHKDFLDWMKGRGILGVRGKPGSGKSTLMKKVFQVLDSSSKNESTCIQLSFFYHRRGTAIQYSEIGMYRTLLHQLLSKIPSAGVEFWQIVENRKKFQGNIEIDWEWRVEGLQQAFYAALLRASTSHKLRIFVDALDEAGTQAAQDIIVQLCEINRKLLRSGAHVSICFSCRHFPNLPVKEDYRVCLEEHNRKDISTYISSELEQRLNFRDAPEREKEVIDTLTYEIQEKAEGIFIWVTLAVKLAANGWNHCSSLRKTQRILKEVPQDLDEMYRHILTHVVDLSKLSQTLQLMQWILLAANPLSVTDLRFAIAAGDTSLIPGVNSCMDSNEFIESDGSMKTLINSITGGLAHVKSHFIQRNDGTVNQTTIVQFIHQSVSDFLLRDKFKCLKQDVSKDVIALSHDRITRSCVNYLKIELRRWQRKEEHEIRQVPFAFYAINYWSLHANKAETCSILQIDLIKQFEWPACRVFKAWVDAKLSFNKWANGFQARFIEAGSNLFHIASASNLKSIVKELLKRDTCIEETDEEGNTAMHYAAVHGHTSVIEILVDSQARISPRNRAGESPLVLTASVGHMDTVEMLLYLGEDINSPMENARTPLHAAAGYGSIPLVRLLLRAGANVNAQGGKYGSALQQAVWRGSEEVVRLLLEAGAHVNAQGGQDGSALQQAIWAGEEKVVRLLLEAGAHVNAQGGKYRNALQQAVWGGSEEVVRLLLEAGAHVNAQGGQDGSALQQAIWAGEEKVVRLLLEAGAHVNAQGGKYRNALQQAVWGGSEEVVRLLLEAGAHVNAQGGQDGSALQQAIWAGEEKVVRLLLEAGAHVNAQGGKDGSALQIAAFTGSKDVVRLLLEAGANINAQGGEYGNALQAALTELGINPAQDVLPVVQHLLGAGADVETLQEEYWERIEGWANEPSTEWNEHELGISKLLLRARDEQRRSRENSKKRPKLRR